MKKIIILMLLLPNLVSANTLYTEYEPNILNTQEYLEETEFLKREEIKIYNTYIEELEEKYLKLSDTNDDYQIDYNDFIYEYHNSLDYSEYAYLYQTKCSNNDYAIKSVIIKNFKEPINISEILFLSKGEKPAYGIKPVNQVGNKKLLYDKDEFGESITLSHNSHIEVYFFEDINLSDLNIKIYSNDHKLNLNSLEIIFNDKYNYITEFALPNQEKNIIDITFDNNYNDFLNNNSFNTINNCISYFSLKIPLYKHSKTNIISLNNYIPLNNSDLFLIDDYKTIYNYYKREKLELEDLFVLKDKEFNIKDYIKFTTIPLEQIKVSHNINYEESGRYNVNIYYQDKLLTNKEISYFKENPHEETEIIFKEEKNIPEETINKEVSSQKIPKKTTKKNYLTTTTKVTTNNVKQVNQENITRVKQNKYQKSISITIISIILIILIIFEGVLLYVKRKYY